MSEARTGHVDPSYETPTRGHEPDRLPVRALVWLVVGFLAFGIATTVGIGWLLEHYVNEPPAVERPRSVVRSDPGPPAGAPPLQPIPRHDRTPSQDLAAMRAAEDRTFAAMGWKVEGRRARIPDDVIRAVATRASTRPSPGGGK